MAIQIVVTILIIIGVAWLFNPYMAQRWRTTRERWTTRERSHGHPFYWRMRYADPDRWPYNDEDAGCPGGSCDQFPKHIYTQHHRDLYNRPAKMQCNSKNVIYIQ